MDIWTPPKYFLNSQSISQPRTKGNSNSTKQDLIDSIKIDSYYSSIIVAHYLINWHQWIQRHALAY